MTIRDVKFHENEFPYVDRLDEHTLAGSTLSSPLGGGIDDFSYEMYDDVDIG